MNGIEKYKAIYELLNQRTLQKAEKLITRRNNRNKDFREDISQEQTEKMKKNQYGWLKIGTE